MLNYRLRFFYSLHARFQPSETLPPTLPISFAMEVLLVLQVDPCGFEEIQYMFVSQVQDNHCTPREL